MFIKASFFTASSPTNVSYQKDALIAIDQGKISEITLTSDSNYLDLLTQARQHDHLIELANDHFLLPGLIDLHNHAPQWPQAGIALDRPLNEWLNHYTFPLEARYNNIDFATTVYTDLVKNLLANGTTTALYFGTIHNQANLKLAEICQKLGQRGFIGSVVMDNPEQTPDYYRDSSTKEAIDKVRTFNQTLQSNRFSDLIAPAITPRFIPSCTTQTLQALGKMAQETNVLVQSHCSESNWEHQYVIERFGQTDTQMLSAFGLLNEKSVFAHATLLSQEDQQTFQTQHAAIAHCPISNSYFGNQILPTKKLHEMGINIGLGSDISGGYSPSLYDNLQHAVTVSQMLNDQTQSLAHRLSANEAFYLATIGGANSLHLQTGRIQAGYQADFQIVKFKDNFTDLVPLDRFSQFLYSKNSENIKAVFVQGQLVHHKGENWYV